MLSVGKVYHIFILSINATTDRERNVVNNNFKLIFTPRTILLGVVNDCPKIPCQYLPPFLSLFDVPQRLQTCDNVIGTYDLHFKV